MRKDPLIFIEHILESIDDINNYMDGVDEQAFMDNREKQDAVLRRIEIIGEAVKNLPEEVKKLREEIPWSKIAGMRDIITHNYFGVDLKLTYQITKKDLPVLKKQVREIKSQV